MTTTYFLYGASPSDITTVTVGATGIGVTSTDDQLLTSAPGTSGTLPTGSISSSATDYANCIAPASSPGASGITGDYTVSAVVTSGNNNLSIDYALYRIDASGVIQAASAYTGSPQTLSAGTKTFSFTALNLGTWAATDRLGASQKRINGAMSSQSGGVSYGASGSTITAPWSPAAADTLFAQAAL